MSANKKLFLSAVSQEFLEYRQQLSKDLKGPTLDVAVQEDFVVSGASTLEKLDGYIQACDGVVHLIGHATGAVPEAPAVAALLAKHPDFAKRVPELASVLALPQPGLSYTQWEAYLARYHQRPLLIFFPTDFERTDSKRSDSAHTELTERTERTELAARTKLTVTREPRFVFDAGEVQAQQQHAARLCDQGLDRGTFASAERLSTAVLRALLALPGLAPSLPRERATADVDISRIDKYAPAELIGREVETAQLAAAWEQAVRGAVERPHVLALVALGGEGKTSLVAKWAAELAHQGWPGCQAAFAWSFYSQGSEEQVAATSELFLSDALTFFGDPEMAGSSAGAFDKGKRLAHLVGKSKALLILDGLEPLQYAPTSPTPGELKDQGLIGLLKGLAASSQGLCVITTRYAIAGLGAHMGKNLQERELPRLSLAAGVALLQSFGVKGNLKSSIPGSDGSTLYNEFEQLVQDVQGHALTLNLLGSYLRDAHAGDIRKRDLISLAEADAEEQGGHAFRVMDAYVKSLEDGGNADAKADRHPDRHSDGSASGQRALALLRLLGLFDRPAAADCLAALWTGDAIPGLTEPLIGLNEAQLNLTLNRLEHARLLTVNRALASGELLSLDAHPLLREYFALRLQTTPETWQAAHRRLYEHLCASTTPDKPDSLEGLQPLYQAVAHGCQAGLQQEACDEVYRDRILRRDEVYSTKKLGALGLDLAAVGCFFETPWSRVSPALTDQAWLLNEAAFRLRALGRLSEALEPMRVSGEMDLSAEHWRDAAACYGNLSELELTMGDVPGAVADAARSITYADRSGDELERTVSPTTHADALHQAGQRAEAEALFREAERMQAELQPEYPLLYALPGFQYCDLLLTGLERQASQADQAAEEAKREQRLADCRAVSERAEQTLEWATPQELLLPIALDHLTLGRAALYAGILQARSRPGEPRQSTAPPKPAAAQSDFSTARQQLEAAVSGLRRAGQQDHLPRGLLSRAWLRSLTGAHSGVDSAHTDLEEAWDIAERGPMPLFLADIHLYRARLFGGQQPYPWESAAQDLAEARRLIEKHGYGRRLGELEDAEAALAAAEGVQRG